MQLTPLRPNKERAKNVVITLFFSFVIYIVSIVSDLMQYEMLQIGFTTEEAEINDQRQLIVVVIHYVIHIFTIIAFISWFRRAYYNLHLRVRHLDHSEGWAAGSWFVPFLNLFRPYEIMKELYVETQKFFDKNIKNNTFKTSTNLVGYWWALWILTSILSRISAKLTTKAETIEEFDTSTILNIITSIVWIPTTIILIKVIKDYSKMEDVLFLYKPEIEEIIISDEPIETDTIFDDNESVFLKGID